VDCAWTACTQLAASFETEGPAGPLHRAPRGRGGAAPPCARLALCFARSAFSLQVPAGMPRRAAPTPTLLQPQVLPARCARRAAWPRAHPPHGGRVSLRSLQLPLACYSTAHHSLLPFCNAGACLRRATGRVAADPPPPRGSAWTLWASARPFTRAAPGRRRAPRSRLRSCLDAPFPSFSTFMREPAHSCRTGSTRCWPALIPTNKKKRNTTPLGSAGASSSRWGRPPPGGTVWRARRRARAPHAPACHL
jgi:hypothetical protein